MKATTTTNTTTVNATSQAAVEQQAAQVGMGVIVTFAALSGLWGATCLCSALAQYGITQTIAGWMQSIGG
ncbi:MAG: hypothetical protein HY885_12160 [Deltaproteobacteria bacterium]|nr:hypothetical protein [Deltaproteobacteria bacterium]